MRYTETGTYSRMLEVLERKQRWFVNMLPNVHGKDRTSLKSRIKTVDKNLALLREPSNFDVFTFDDLVTLWADCNGQLWSSDEVSLFSLPCRQHEGKGEKSLRRRLGLPLQPTQCSADLPSGEEIKHGTVFRLGIHGKKTYIRLLASIPDDLMQDADMLWDGEVTTATLTSNKLHMELWERLTVGLLPERVLSCYPAIYLTTNLGFIRVPREDYYMAFKLQRVTQYGPKYQLYRQYLEHKLRETLADDQTKVVA